LVRGPSIFGGYLNYDGPSPFIQWDSQSWYRTGDLVRADQNGHLTFMGRLKRFVKIGGEMISLPAIEEVLEHRFPSPPDKGPGLAVIESPDENHTELILFSASALDRAQVNLVIRDAGLSPLHNIRAVVQIEQLPVLGTGKTDYRALSAMLKTGAKQTNLSESAQHV
ncbi:MAG TPA: 2-acyl-glycerophospho-ethanolamine acyltransferase, partial [Phycisphaerae bacterium]|nr:2-acyl-glycerophospho-ethanolamine acyltransferase [Phycisphaerae bacterium]